MLQEIFDALKRRPETTYSDVGVNVGVNERKILNCLSENGHVTAKQLAEFLSITPRQAERILKKLKEKGRIRRIGSDKSGYWDVVK